MLCLFDYCIQYVLLLFGHCVLDIVRRSAITVSLCGSLYMSMQPAVAAVVVDDNDGK